MARPNYQRDKRQRDLARQQKQEEKRQKKALRGSGGGEPGDEGGAVALETDGRAPAQEPSEAPTA